MRLERKLADRKLQLQIDSYLNAMPAAFSEWGAGEQAKGHDAAQKVDHRQPILFLGAGPARGAAMFAAAKVIEAVGQSASSQDVEEWAHLEYFNDPPPASGVDAEREGPGFGTRA